MLKSRYLNEHDLMDFGFKSLGSKVQISEDARIYGQENISIGSNVRIDDFVILVAVKGYINIGNYIQICRGSHIAGTLGVEIDDFASMAANTVIYSNSDDYSGETMTNQLLPLEYTSHHGGKVVIGRHVIIGSGCSIVGPCILGEGSSVGAMSLVIKDLEPWTMNVGIPAKQLKARKRDLLKLEERFLEEQRLKQSRM